MLRFGSIIVAAIAAALPSGLSALGQDLIATYYPPVIQASAGFTDGMATDSSGNQYVVGTCGAVDIDFNPLAGEDIISNPDGHYQHFLTKYNADGTYAWTSTYGGTGSNFGHWVAVDDARAFLVGQYLGKPFIYAVDTATGSPLPDFGTGGITSLASGGWAYGVTIVDDNLYVVGQFGNSSANAFIAAMNADSGELIDTFGTNGLVTFGTNNTGNASAKAVVESNGKLYIAGSFEKADNGFGGSGSIDAVGADAFLMVLDATTGAPDTNFNSTGIVTMGGSDLDQAFGVTVSDGIVYVCGRYSSTDATFYATPLPAPGQLAGAFVFASDASTGAAIAAFGNNGILALAEASYLDAKHMIVAGNRLYVGGTITRPYESAPFADFPTVPGGQSAYVLALDASTGAPVTGFGADGIQLFVAGEAYGEALGFAAGRLFLCGFFLGNQGGIGAPGPFESWGTGGRFQGLLLPLDDSGNFAPIGGTVDTTALSITISNGIDEIDVDGPVTYMVTVTNAGPDAADGAYVGTAFPSDAPIVEWSASFDGGASGTATGAGQVLEPVTLPAGSSATYLVTAYVSITAPSPLVAKAFVCAPSQAADSDQGDNLAVDSDVVIGPVDNPPLALADELTVAEGQAGTIAVLANDLPMDLDDPIYAGSVQITASAAHGSLQVNGDGTVTYTHDDSENHSDSFAYTVDDESGNTSNSATVSIAITPINDAPVANDDSAGVNEGQSVNIGVADNDTDADNALDLTSIQIVSGATHGSLQVNTDGTVDYTHDGSENFSDSFTYTVDDADGATSNTATVSITISPVNDKPVAEILGSDPFYVAENEALPFEGSGADAEDGANVTYDWEWDDGSPNGSAQNPSHAWDTPGTYTVTLVVTDQDGLPGDPVSVQVIVLPKAGERDLFLKRGRFTIDWKAHVGGLEKDSFLVQGCLNPAGGSTALDSATFELSVNGVSLGAVPLASNGKGIAVVGVALAKSSLKAKTGAFTFSIKDADLRAALGLSNADEAGDVELAIEASVTGGGLATESFAAHAAFAYATKRDVHSKGSFNFKTSASSDGYFVALKTSVCEDKAGAHKISAKGYVEAPGDASIFPAGDVTLMIGAQEITIPVGSLTASGGVISLTKGAHPDFAKFVLDTNKRLFTIQTNPLFGTGVPPAGNPATSHDLLLRVEIPTAGDTVILETTVEILRSSPTAKKWRR